MTHILYAVQNDELFGMIEVDIYVPEDLWDKFSEMSPLFCTVDVPVSEIGELKQNFVKTNGLSTKPRRLLVGGMKAEKILLATPLLKYYLQKGVKVTRVYQVLEFQKMKCFEKFCETVTNARRQGASDISQNTMAKTMKLVGNSAYGSLIMNKENLLKLNLFKGKGGL